MKLKLYNPLKRCVVTQGFGFANTSPDMLEKYRAMGLSAHNGVDYFAIDGTPVYASHNGRVIFAGYDGAGGLGVVIRTTEEFELDGKISLAKSIYWHLKRGSLCVTGGQEVKRGDKIGEADNTGFSTGSHLHFGLKPIAKGENDWTYINLNQEGYNGAIDPTPYFVKFQNEMKRGDQSQDVRDLQEFLKTIGFFNVTPTGYYGVITAQSVLSFQLKYCTLSWYERFVMKGSKVGEKTLSALNTLYE